MNIAVCIGDDDHLIEQFIYNLKYVFSGDIVSIVSSKRRAGIELYQWVCEAMPVGACATIAHIDRPYKEGYNKTMAYERTREFGYATIMLDMDELIEHHQTDIYTVPTRVKCYSDTFVYFPTKIIPTQYDVKWVGDIHAYPDLSKIISAQDEGFIIKNTDNGARSFDRHETMRSDFDVLINERENCYDQTRLDMINSYLADFAKELSIPAY